MGQRERKPLYFGMGLDRVSGAMVADPTSFHDLRNVHLLNGRAEFRRGLQRQLAIPAPWTDLLGVYLIRAAGLNAVVVFNSVSKKVGLYALDGTGSFLSYVADMWTMPTATPPRITAADQYGTLLIAHDEANFGNRQNTMVYNSTDASLGPLMLDLARIGTPAPVKFRGVAKHLAYLLAWGYGVNVSGQADRGEVLRISLPGEPTNFVPEHYFLVGTQGDPIVGGGVCGGKFAVQKIDASYLLNGYDRATFGIGPMDEKHGLVSPRAGVSVNDEWFFYSLGGPRSSVGGPSSDLAAPLDLQGTSPDALATVGSIEDTFAFYDVDKAEVVFVRGQWGQVLHLGDGDRRWSFRPYAIPLLNAGLLFTGGSPGTVITAHPEYSSAFFNSPSYGVGDGDPVINVNWTIVGGSVTDENCEVWAQAQDVVGAAWVRVINVAAGTLTGSFKPKGWQTNYRLAIRFVSGGLAGAGYTDADPWNWPIVARATVLSEGEVVGWFLGKWRRLDGTTQGYNALYFAGPGVNATPGLITIPYHFRVEVRYDGGGWTLVNANVAYADILTAVRVTNSDSLKSALFRVRVEGPSHNSPWFELSAYPEKIIGPEPPSSITVDAPPVRTPNDNPDQHDVHWGAPALIDAGFPLFVSEMPTNDGPTNVRGRHLSPPASPGAYGTIETTSAGGHTNFGYPVPLIDPSSGGTRSAEVSVRTDAGGGDVSAWVTGTRFEP